MRSYVFIISQFVVSMGWGDLTASDNILSWALCLYTTIPLKSMRSCVNRSPAIIFWSKGPTNLRLGQRSNAFLDAFFGGLCRYIKQTDNPRGVLKST